MKYFISFQKKKALPIELSEIDNKNESLVHMLNHELMTTGYFLNKEVFEALSKQSTHYIQHVYNDLIKGIKRVTGGTGYETIYRNFPQSVIVISYTEFAINAILHYWSFGTWRPEDEGYLTREFKLEPVKFKEIKLLTNNEYNSIFTDILYSGTSISSFDKEIIDYFISSSDIRFDFSKISFKETAAYVGKRLLLDVSTEILPTKDATNVLRIYSAFSDGDEGLKVNTEFRNPTSRQRKVLLKTLELCYNLEESFKIYREKWLRLLFYLNPMTKDNTKLYPLVYSHTILLRNTPKQLKTYNSKVEELIGKKDKSVLDLLKQRSGVFMRRIDHTVRLFGIKALDKWLETTPNLLNLVSTYNHFTDRDKEQDGRAVVLASQTKSEVVSFEAQAPLDTKLVKKIKKQLLTKINSCKSKELSAKKIYIDRSLYYRPLAINNRASSLSLDGKCNGTVEITPEGKTIRMYVHWHGSSDIDLSAFVIKTDNEIVKVGWNSYHHSEDEAVVYSGDNTGLSAKNAEYMDVSPDKLTLDTEWVIVEARIFRGPNSFKGYDGKTRAGWMMREFPEAGLHWEPKTLEHSVVLASESNTAYLMAYHVATRSIVYLDLSMGYDAVSTAEDAVKIKVFLNNFITLDDGKNEINWEKLNQGHILNVITNNIVEDEKDADLVFNSDSTWESIAKYL